MRRALVALVVASLGVAAGVFTLGLVSNDPTFSFAGTSLQGRLALVGAGWALIAVGVALQLRGTAHAHGALLVAAGFAWFLLEWSTPAAESAAAFSIGLALYATCAAFVGHAVLAFPRARLASRLERVAVGVAYAGSLLALGLLPALLFDPRAEACSDCPRNLLLVSARPDTVDDLYRLGIWFGVVWASALAVLTIAKLVRSSEAARRAGWLVFVAGGLYLSLVAATYAASVDRGILWNGHLGRRLWLGEALALVGIALGVAWSWIRLRRSRAAVARLVVELAQSPPPGGLRDVLARIVDDPELELAYPLDESDRLVDVRGVTVAFAAGKEQTRLIGDGRPLAVLGHAAGSLDDEQLVGEVASAARLALENERLQAQVHARVDQLRRSRSRIVEAGDAERVRLERDLHDGAQQRLVGLALSLRLLRSRLAEGVAQDVSAQLEVAEAELHAAIEDLRRLAHGIFPAVLADGGLRAALIALAEEAPVPIQIEDLDPGRYARRLEAAAYTVIAETARAADGGLAVRTTRSNGALVLEIDAHGVGAGLDRTELEDRVGAAEGRLAVEGRNGDLSIRADFPCAL